jgi:uncharacterized phage protein (TIGR01671 family)
MIAWRKVMDREIKFRAWNKTMGIMVDLQKLTPLATEIDGLFIPKSDDIIPLQYTGLKDSKGNEVYEGDVVSHPLNGNYKGSVMWANETGRWVVIPPNEYNPNYAMWLTESNKFEVIGSIFENPELLEVK